MAAAQAEAGASAETSIHLQDTKGQAQGRGGGDRGVPQGLVALFMCFSTYLGVGCCRGGGPTRDWCTDCFGSFSPPQTQKSNTPRHGRARWSAFTRNVDWYWHLKMGEPSFPTKRICWKTFFWNFFVEKIFCKFFLLELFVKKFSLNFFCQKRIVVPCQSAATPPSPVRVPCRFGA